MQSARSCKQLSLLCQPDLSHWPGACPTKYRIDQIRSNSNFAWNSYRCAFEDSRPIITKFGTRHDCTKFRYDRPTIIEIRGTRIFSKFWIRSNLSIRYLVGQAPGTALPSGFQSSRGIHRSLVDYPHKVQWRGVLMLSLICVWINVWENNQNAGDLRRDRSQYDVTVM